MPFRLKSTGAGDSFTDSTQSLKSVTEAGLAESASVWARPTASDTSPPRALGSKWTRASEIGEAGPDADAMRRVPGWAGLCGRADSGRISMREVDGWQILAETPSDQI
jgi:hypothetical protein